MKQKKIHPSQRFDAPNAITKGNPLKFLISETLVDLIAESFADAWDGFDTECFVGQAGDGLDALELKERG